MFDVVLWSYIDLLWHTFLMRSKIQLSHRYPPYFYQYIINRMLQKATPYNIYFETPKRRAEVVV